MGCSGTPFFVPIGKPNSGFRRNGRSKNDEIMKWLTIDYIKAHSRIDYDCEDSLLELYGDAAEATVMNIIGRDYDEIVEKFGTDTQEIPAPLIQASLILVDTSYQFRAAISTQNIYNVPNTFDFLVKPYMRYGWKAEHQKPEEDEA